MAAGSDRLGAATAREGEGKGEHSLLILLDTIFCRTIVYKFAK